MEISFGHPERERITFFVHDDISKQLQMSADLSMTTRVEIRAGGFSGHADLWLEVSDFARFAPEVKRLYETLSGEAHFETIESQISLILKGDGRGHLNLSGFLLDRCGDGNKLQFSLDFDQTLLRRSILELEGFLNAIAKARGSVR